MTRCAGKPDAVLLGVERDVAVTEALWLGVGVVLAVWESLGGERVTDGVCDSVAEPVALTLDVADTLTLCVCDGDCVCVELGPHASFRAEIATEPKEPDGSTAHVVPPSDDVSGATAVPEPDCGVCPDTPSNAVYHETLAAADALNTSAQ